MRLRHDKQRSVYRGLVVKPGHRSCREDLLYMSDTVVRYQSSAFFRKVVRQLCKETYLHASGRNISIVCYATDQSRKGDDRTKNVEYINKYARCVEMYATEAKNQMDIFPTPSLFG
jgi:hypothetical protein